MAGKLEETLFEKYFSGCNLTQEELWFYIQMLRQTREIKNSIYGGNFELVYMKLYKEDDNIRFDGASSNNLENRCISGNITKDENGSYIVESNICRLCIPYTKIEEKEYTSIDEFNVTIKGIVHRTKYLGLRKNFRETFRTFDLTDYENFKKEKIKKI